ncbi:MAG: arginyltransferase [Gammaproteobacteria bacterium]|nr:arginyltransferase [Gammaproteobacteria bacterium]
MNDQTKLHFYASTPETCSYLPGRQSISAFANPHIDMDVETYNELIQFGFRRSGGYLYRPHCPNCEECISTRVVVNQYKFSRNDKRTLRKNNDLTIKLLEGKFTEEHFELYRRYINSRHIGGSMENPSRSDYHRFLICDWTDTSFIEFRKGKKLLAIAVTDTIDTGHSAVYTFFDPEETQRSLGHFAILKQIKLTIEDALPYLYLGYWIKGCDKMSYKSRYKPAEGFINDVWVELNHS